FLHSIAPFGQSLAITRWLMGGIEAIEMSTLAWLAATLIPAFLVALLHARKWNLLAIGEDWASARGVATERYMLIGYLLSSLLTGAVTALTGPIGFVGLIVPHALRLKLGADHRVLIPASVFIGAAFLAICDTISRILLAPAEVPVGVITAILGGPIFIWMLRSR
ncbi:MAG: iron ABC transporter permease, partial [Bryobacteraceae bacterium]